MLCPRLAAITPSACVSRHVSEHATLVTFLIPILSSNNTTTNAYLYTNQDPHTHTYICILQTYTNTDSKQEGEFMDARQGNRITVLMLPWLAHGHISPFLELAKSLSKRNFFIYLCSSPINLSSIKNRISQKDSISIKPVELQIPSSPELPPHYHTTNGLPPHLMPKLKETFDMSKQSFFNVLRTLKPDIVIYDFLQPWAPAVAEFLNIPAVLYLSPGAASTCFLLHFNQNLSPKSPSPAYPSPESNFPANPSQELQSPANPSLESNFPANPCQELHFPANPPLESHFPANPSVKSPVPANPSRELTVSSNPSREFPFPAIYLQDHETMATSRLLESKSNAMKDSDRFIECTTRSTEIALIKTCREIEGKYIDYLSESIGKRVVPVGPLVQEVAMVESDEQSPIFQWLNKKEKGSSVFVSFGSEYFLSREEMEEVAHGLELSNVNFIWVVRFPQGERISVQEALPKGFLKRIAERGMVLGNWAPQAKILGHEKIGGFVSHCGWSSVIEGIKLGVPIIALPMQLDQPLNARLVEELGVGVEAKRDNCGRLDRRVIAEAVRKVVVKRSGEGVRKKVKEVSREMREKGEEEMDEVVEELARLCGERKRGRFSFLLKQEREVDR